MVGRPSACTFFSHWFRFGPIQHCQNKAERSQCCNSRTFQGKKASLILPNLPPAHSRFPWSWVPASFYCNPREICSLQALHLSALLPRGVDTASFWAITLWLQAGLSPAPFWVTTPPSSSSPIPDTSLLCCSRSLHQHLLLFLLCSQSCLCDCEQIDRWCPGCTGLDQALPCKLHARSPANAFQSWPTMSVVSKPWTSPSRKCQPYRPVVTQDS